MIVKSMPYKDPNFRRLYAYIQRKAVEGCCVVRNLPFADSQDGELILQSFEENVSLLPKRKNGNLFYHEIISIQPKNGVSVERHLQALHDLTHYYLDQRAGLHPAFGRVHYEPGNMHIHLMVTANELYSTKRHRLQKQRFSMIQRKCERWFNATFPELEQDTVYNREAPGRRPSLRESERAKRTKEPSKKELLTQQLKNLLQNPQGEGDFTLKLKAAGMKFYQRGKTKGVVFEGKKYRLKTLGVLEQYEAAQARWALTETRKRDFEAFYEMIGAQGKREFELPPTINPPVGWG